MRPYGHENNIAMDLSIMHNSFEVEQPSLEIVTNTEDNISAALVYRNKCINPSKGRKKCQCQHKASCQGKTNNK